MQRPASLRSAAVPLSLRAAALGLLRAGALLALTASAGLAQQAKGPSFLPGSSSHEPTNIAADKLDYFDKEQKLIYTGNVVAVQGDSRLNASVLTILLDKKKDDAAPGGKSGEKPAEKPAAKPAAASEGPAAGGPGNSSVRRMEGKGPITLTNKEQVGTGDALVYDKPENKFYLIGNVTLSQGDNITRGDKLVYDLATGQAVVSSKGRVRSLIVPGDQPKPGEAPKPDAAKPGAAPKTAAQTKPAGVGKSHTY